MQRLKTICQNVTLYLTDGHGPNSPLKKIRLSVQLPDVEPFPISEQECLDCDCYPAADGRASCANFTFVVQVHKSVSQAVGELTIGKGEALTFVHMNIFYR